MSASASPKVHRVRFKDPRAWLSACVFVASCAESPTGNGTPPEDAADARLKIDMVNDQLAGKEMTIGRWYLRNGDTLAAVGRFRTVVDRCWEALERTRVARTLRFLDLDKRTRYSVQLMPRAGGH